MAALIGLVIVVWLLVVVLLVREVLYLRRRARAWRQGAMQAATIGVRLLDVYAPDDDLLGEARAILVELKNGRLP